MRRADCPEVMLSLDQSKRRISRRGRRAAYDFFDIVRRRGQTSALRRQMLFATSITNGTVSGGEGGIAFPSSLALGSSAITISLRLAGALKRSLVTKNAPPRLETIALGGRRYVKNGTIFVIMKRWRAQVPKRGTVAAGQA